MAERIQFCQIIKFLPALVALFALSVEAAEKIKMEAVAGTNVIQVYGHIVLPPGKKLNKQAPSKITVFEKVGTSWEQVTEIKLADYFTTNEKLDVSREIKLKSTSSRLKVTASLYHCDRVTSQYCVIDDFEGEVSRNPAKSSNVLQIDLAGSSK
jgi:hypothetical protein